MKMMKKLIPGLCLLAALLALLSVTALAAGEEETDVQDTAVVETQQDSTGDKAIACAVAVGLAAAGGAIGMGLAIAKSADGISRQPEAEGKIRTTLMLGLVFIETAIIYALLVAILIIFVL
jgi:F-type H+-transporting ATPase subunit c